MQLVGVNAALQLMVCSMWSGKMTALVRLVDAGSVSLTAIGNDVNLSYDLVQVMQYCFVSIVLLC